MSEEVENKAQSIEKKIKSLQNWLEKANEISNNYQRSIQKKSVEIFHQHYLLEENAFKSARYSYEISHELKEFAKMIQKFNINSTKYSTIFETIPQLINELFSFSKSSKRILSQTSSTYKKITQPFHPKENLDRIESILSLPKLNEEFKNYCEKRLYSEIYEFLMDIHKYYLTECEEEIETFGNEIMEKYINEHGQNHINIRDSIVISLESQLSKPSFKYYCDFFNPAEKEIMSLLSTNALPDFRSSFDADLSD